MKLATENELQYKINNVLIMHLGNETHVDQSATPHEAKTGLGTECNNILFGKDHFWLLNVKTQLKNALGLFYQMGKRGFILVLKLWLI